MSDPQTFEELRRMARELPKNVLVPAQHIHSLLEEIFGMIERIADLQRQLAEAKAEALEEAEATLGGTSEIVRKGDLRAKAAEYRAKAEIEAKTKGEYEA